MTAQMTVEDCYAPVYHDNGDGTGKFYDAIIVRADYLNANNVSKTTYVPVFNWGKGYPSQFQTGSFTLGSMHPTIGQAKNEAGRKMRSKMNGGYNASSAFALSQGAQVPRKVRDKIDGIIGGSAAFHAAAAPNATAPSKRGALPKKVTTDSRSEVVQKFEALATDVLTAPNLDVAITKLGTLKVLLAGVRAEFTQIEDAVGMANDYVASRLAK